MCWGMKEKNTLGDWISVESENVGTLTDNGAAETDGSYRAHSQAACALD
jgi:hypothetical protein